MSEEQRLTSCFNLTRRLPPSKVENSLAGLVDLAPDLIDELYTQVDLPLEVVMDTSCNKEFVVCDYNRDEDSHRSPHSNKYFPEMASPGFTPSSKLREMEISANRLFDTYRNLYFEGGLSSVYFFETDGADSADAFGACWVIHKDVESTGNMKESWWDSTHVFEVTPAKNGKFTYKLTTTVMVSIVLKDEKVGGVDLSGLRTQQNTQESAVKTELDHVSNMGEMLEKAEQRVRNAIEGIYIQKTRQVINGIRSATSERDAQIDMITKSLNAAIFSRK